MAAARKTSRSRRTSGKPLAPVIESTENQRVRLFVSSVVYGYEDFLESIYAILENFGYEVLMSHKGTVPINPAVSAMTSCLEGVDRCDLFLGIILPRYGSGQEEGEPYSITHREALHAIKLNKPRWFLVHEHVTTSRKLLDPYRDKTVKDRFALQAGMTFQRTAILDDLRVIDLYELAMRQGVTPVKARKGNWVQSFSTDEDARLFATAQFRRQREVEQMLPRLRNPKALLEKGGRTS